MFNNIGRKIKVTAKVFCWIGIIASVLGGVGMIAVSLTGYAPVTGILSGVGVALLGSLLSWVGSFMMIGFGDLVENTAEIAANTKKKNNKETS